MAVHAVAVGNRIAGGRLTNKEIARILYDVAEILELKGESLFRVIAYRNAARSIEFLAEDVHEVSKDACIITGDGPEKD
jgi:DNA polymerase (family 10)